LKTYRLFGVCTLSLLLCLNGCGGGGSSEVATAAANTTTTSSGTQTTVQTSTQNGAVTTTVNNISTADTMNGIIITNRSALAMLAASVAAVPVTTAQSEAVTYPIAGKQFFRNFVGVSGSDPNLLLMNSTISSARTVIIVGEFQSFTAARVFPCTFNTADYKVQNGDCNAVNIGPGPYPVQSSAGSKCRSITYQSGIIEQCIRD
jgi:hypothetical protein